MSVFLHFAFLDKILFSVQKYWYFLISSRKHMLWYSLEAPRRGASNEYLHVFMKWKNINLISTLISRHSVNIKVEKVIWDTNYPNTCLELLQVHEEAEADCMTHDLTFRLLFWNFYTDWCQARTKYWPVELKAKKLWAVEQLQNV